MTLARHKQICLSATPYYHCISRCVRRAFLCGKDSYTKKNYESRRIWVEERLHDLSQIFAIDIAAYSVMSNHLHVVLHVNAKEANQLSSKQVIAKWHKLYGGTPLSKRVAKGETLLGLEKDILNESIATWRNRLKDISWFMRCLNEYIARRANEEDECSGRFWEGRFKSKALLDDKALLACMAYVDLNPVRANMCKTPRGAKHTSIKLRLLHQKSQNQPKTLLPFLKLNNSNISKNNIKTMTYISYSLEDYIELLECTVGAKKQSSSLLTNILCCSNDDWDEIYQKFEEKFKTLVGASKAYKKLYCMFGLKRRRGLTNCKRYFG